MQVTLKQNEITAAIAAYLQNVLGVTGVSPETLSVVYKQGRSDKNGMTAELEIEAPKYDTGPKGIHKTASSIGDASLHSFAAGQVNLAAASANTTLGNGQSDVTSASVAPAPEPAPVVVADAVEPSSVYDGERRAESRDELVDNLPEVAVQEPEVLVNTEDRVAELTDEVATALAEDEAADATEAAVAEPVAEVATPLFG